MVILLPFPKFNVATVKVWEWMNNINPLFTGYLITCDYLSMLNGPPVYREESGLQILVTTYLSMWF